LKTSSLPLAVDTCERSPVVVSQSPRLSPSWITISVAEVILTVNAPVPILPEPSVTRKATS
jgi:hypothetical protein